MNEEKEMDYRHLMQWLMFLLTWLVFIEVYSGYWIMDILKWIITFFLVLFFLIDVRRYS